jgi:hypothetical protein
MATSNKTRNRSFRGGGGMYLRERGATAGFFQVGNADTLQFAINEEKQTQRNYQQPGGGNIASESSITDVTASINVLSINPRIAAVALRALVNTVESASISAESHQAYSDMFIPFEFLPDFDQAVTVTDSGAVTTYVAGTDYLIRNNGIFIDPDGSIPDDSEILITYQSKAQYNIETITKSAVEYEMFFDGFNEADNGKAVSVTCHRISFSPAQALSLITEDFGALPMEFEVLADDSKDGSTESQYFVVRLEQ